MIAGLLRALCLLVAGGAASAQLVFDDPLVVPVSSSDEASHAIGDVDGDGVLDVVSAADDRIEILFGAGDGTFPTTATLAGRAEPVALLDVGGDGALDLLHGCAGCEGTLLVSHGLGDGTFAPATLVTQLVGDVGEGGWLDLGDVDGDGETDVLFASNASTGGEQSVLLGDGLGGFTTIVLGGTGVLQLPYTMLVDLDGDGLDDVARTLPRQWRRSLGDGTFADATAMSGLPVGGDLVGDAREETYVLESVDGGFVVRFRSALGAGFVDVAVSEPVLGTCGFAQVHAADLDGDGLLDLFVSCIKQAFVLRQAPGAAFELAGGVAYGGSLLAGTVGAADFDDDGRVDLAVRSSTAFRAVPNATYLPGDPFTALGGAMIGKPGFAVQVAEQDAAALSLRVFGARNAAPAFAVVGAAALDAPFAGGLLVPTPDIVAGPFTTSPTGTLDFTAPAVFPLPPGLEAFVQWWLPDVEGGGDGGYAATAALRIAAPG